jgi:hypothetical protein
MEIDRELDDVLNLRPCGANRGNWSIFGWEGRGVVCRYSRLQGGSPHMRRLMIVRSGTLSKYLNCTDRMLALWDPVNQRGLTIVVVGRYPTIHL